MMRGQLLSDAQPRLAADAPVCARCAPSWATTSGRVLYLLLAIGVLLLGWKFGLFRSAGEMTPNPRSRADAPRAAVDRRTGFGRRVAPLSPNSVKVTSVP